MQHDDAQACLHAAQLAHQQGQLEEAELHYRQALRAAPREVAALEGLAGVALRAGDLEAAIMHYQAASALEPDNLRIHEDLRNALIAQRSFDWRADVTKALQILRREDSSADNRLAACRLLIQYGVTYGLEAELQAQARHSEAAADLLRAARQLERTGLARPLPSAREATGSGDEQLILSFGATEIASPGSDTLVIVFGGANHRLGLSFDIIQRILRASSVSTLYLRDLERTWYLDGIVGIGSGFDAAAAGLRAAAHRLGARRILAIANCLGCAGALRYGLEVGAEAILGLAPRIRVPTAPVRAALPRDRLSRLLEEQPRLAQDLRGLYDRAHRPPRLNLIYGEDCAEDAADARHLAGLPGVSIIGIAGYAGHGCLNLLLGRGLLTELLSGFVRDGTIRDELRLEIERAAHPPTAAP